MVKNEIKEEIKNIDAKMNVLNAQMNDCWAKASESNQEGILLRVKLKRMSKIQQTATKVLLGISAIFFATAIFINPVLLMGTTLFLCSSFAVSGICISKIEKDEQKIKEFEKNYKINKEKQEELFTQIEELKNKRYHLVCELEKLNSENKVEGLGKIEPIKSKAKKFIKRRNDYEK